MFYEVVKVHISGQLSAVCFQLVGNKLPTLQRPQATYPGYRIFLVVKVLVSLINKGAKSLLYSPFDFAQGRPF